MKVFTKKRILLISVLVLLIAAMMAIAIPTLAATPETYYGVNVSMSGDVSLNFIYTDLGDADSVVVVKRDGTGAEMSRTTLAAEDVPADKNGRYVVSAKLAAAEMTDHITVYTQKNGIRLGEARTYSVKAYADEVLANDDFAEYHAAVRAMLNYGAMSQAHFGVNTSNLANAGIYRGETNPINAVTDIDCAAPSWTDGETLVFKSCEAVLESKVAFKLYFTYSGNKSLSATVEREGLDATATPVYRDSDSGVYYVRINNIAAKLYDKQYTVKVTDGEDDLSMTAGILNYADAVLSDENTTETQKNAVRAMYNHYIWTANAAPAFTDCEHTYTHQESADKNSATSYVCSTCGVEVDNVSDSIEWYVSSFDIANKYASNGSGQTSEIVTESNGSVYARVYGGNTSTPYNTLWPNGSSTKETGRYFIMKYRLPDTNSNDEAGFRMYVDTFASTSNYHSVNFSTHQDNEWHTVVIDLASATNDGFAMDIDLKYYARNLWMRPLSWKWKSGTTTDYMDIAYVAMCNDLADVSGVVDEETYERHLKEGVSTVVSTATNECIDHNAVETLSDTKCSYVCQTCEKQLGSVSLDGINYYRSAAKLYTCDYSGGHYVFKGSYLTEGDQPFSRFIINGNNGAGHIYVHGHTQANPYDFNGSSGRYLVLKIRSSGTIRYWLELATVAGGQIASGNRLASDIGLDNVWQTVVVDLNAYANYSIYDESDAAGLVFRITTGKGTIGKDYIDIAYFAIVDDLGEAKQVIGEETYHYYSNPNQWATVGVECNTSTMSCKGECTPTVTSVTCTGGNIYSYCCSSCGHEYSDSQFVSSNVNWFRSAQNLYSNYYSASDKKIMTDDDGTLFVRLNGGQGSGSYNTFDLGTPGTSLSIGQYYVVKYRLRSDNPTDQSTQHLYMQSYSVTNKTAGSYTGAITYQTHQDDEWHVAVIDLSKHPTAANFKVDETDGLYHLSKLWMRPLTTNGASVPNSTTEDYIDYAYVAMCDSIEDIRSLVGDGTFEMHTSDNSYYLIDAATGECVVHDYVESGSENAYVYTCSVCGKVADIDVDRYFPVSTNKNVEAFQLSATMGVDEINKLSYIRYTGLGKAGQVNPFRHPVSYSGTGESQKVDATYGKGTPFNIGSGDKYLVVKIRTNANDWKLGMYLGTKDANTVKIGEDGYYTGSVNKLYIGYPMSQLKAGEWQTIVIDMASVLGQNWVANSNGEYVMETLQFHSDMIPADNYFDLAYYAFCDSWEDIAALTGDKKAILVESSYSGRIVNSDGSCSDGNCAIDTSYADGIYKQYCTVCGKVYTERDVSDANLFLNAHGLDAYSGLYFGTTYATEYDVVTGKYETYVTGAHSRADNTEGWIYLFCSHVTGSSQEVNIANTGRYLIFRMRSDNLTKLTIEAYTGTNAKGSATRTVGFNQGWETVVVDMSGFSSWTVGAEDTVFYLRLRAFKPAVGDELNMQFAYAAIVDSLEEVAAVTGDDEVSLYTDWAGSSVIYTKTDVECTGSVLGHSMTAATCTSVRVCDACGIEYAGALGHTYVNTVAREYLASRATDDTKAVFYRSCSCGAVSSDTFEYGKTINEMVDYTKTERFDAVSSEIVNGEKFLFFTDPHYVQSAADGVINYSYEYAIDVMGKYFDKSGVSFTLCGGDWLNNSNSRENAIANLKDIDARMQAAFGKDYYLIVGNHDYNYQMMNEAGTGTVGSPHWLTREELDGAWYTDERYGGKSYYSFEGENTKFYVFDSGIDWSHSKMDAFDIAQVEWFLSELAENDDAHIALAPHILYTSGTTMHPATDKILEFSNAYNERGAVSFNGKLYDFADKTGKVEFLIGGHSHRDEVAVYHNIPCVLTINNGSNCPSFDLVAVDYDAKVVHLTRVNAGTAANAQALDRTVSLEVAAE